MSFGNRITSINICPKASLQPCHDSNYPSQSDNLLKKQLNNDRNFQRTFFLPPSFVKASLCAEASLSFSFFLLFFVNVFSLIFLFVTYAYELTQLQQRGKETAAYVYAMDGFMDHNEDLIILRESREIDTFLTVIPMPSCSLYMKCAVKPWTGYDVTKQNSREAEEELVYVTEHGQVYHKDRSCSHISLSIHVTTVSEISDQENTYGDRYRACEHCGDSSFTTILFITSHGDRYHSTISCRGLKRTVKAVPLSETVLPACSKCVH